jgi:large repetitive protein
MLTDACSKTDLTLSYRLLFDLDENGSMETVINSGTPGAYPIERTLKGDTLLARIKFPDTFALVHGRHKVEWIAGDKCGGWSVCKYEFLVKDCKAPAMACRPGLGVNIMNSQPAMVTIWDKDFIIKVTDNCTPPDGIRTAIRKTGTGSGFPTEKSVTFDCMELGAQSVDVWAIDAAGNADFCRTQIRVQDNSGSCPASLPFSGKIYTPEGVPTPGVEVALRNANKSSLQLNAVTDSAGVFAIGAMPAQCAYSLKPGLNIGLLDGVDVLDALLLDAHVQGVETLDSPYRLLAADVNRSGKITADDVQVLTEALTGAKTAFPSNTSWRFVPAVHNFPDIANPFKTAIPETSVFCMSGNAPAATDFVAVKVGDLTEDGGEKTTQSSDYEAGMVHFTVPARKFKAGDTLHLALATPVLNALTAFQLAVLFDSAVLSLQNIEPGLLNSKQFYFNKKQHCVAAAWHSVKQLNEKPAFNGRHNAFTLVFIALQDGSTDEALHTTEQPAAARAYDSDSRQRPATLDFEPEAAGERGGPIAIPEVGLNVQPNPTRDLLTAAFYTPADGPLQFELVDLSGKTAIRVQNMFSKGYGEQRLEIPASVSAGVYFLRMSGAQGVWTTRVTVAR